MKGKRLTAEEIAKCEKLIAKGFKNIEIEEMTITATGASLCLKVATSTPVE